MMFMILGGDGKEYGPADAATLRRWIAENRANGQTKVRAESTSEWKPLSELPEFAEALGKGAGPAVPSTPPPLAGALPSSAPRSQGMAVASLVLGILGLACVGPITGIPALILGLIALSRSRRQPEAYGGGGLAIAGIATGACSFAMVFILAGMLLPALAKAKAKAQSIACINNLKQVGLAARIYATDNDGLFPPNFQVMSNELVTPKVLCCPEATDTTPAPNWEGLLPENVSYEWSGADLKEGEVDPSQVIARCHRHGHVVLADGSVQTRRSAGGGGP